MNIEKSMNRLAYTIAKGNKPNQTDVAAFNDIVEWINLAKEERLSRNHHFSKIAVIYYCDLLQRYSWDKFLAEKEIQQLLEQPLKDHYERFRTLMNIKEWYDAASIFGLNMEHVLNGKTPKEIEAIKNTDRQIIKENQKELLKSLNPWGEKEITNKLNDFLSELLIRYENK